MMRRTIPLLLIGVALAVIAASFARHGCCDAMLEKSAGCGDTRCWFRCEFRLDAATCAAIDSARVEYEKACEKLCADVRRASASLDALPADAAPEVRREAESALVRAEEARREARVAQAHRIAGLMPKEKGERYLRIVLPHLTGPDRHEVSATTGSVLAR